MQKKILGAFFIVLLLGILLTGSLFMGLIRSSYMNELEARLISNGKLIEQFLTETELSLAEGELNKIVKEYGDRIEARITLINGQGVVVADNAAEKSNMENHRERQEVKRALEGEIGTTTRYSSTLGADMFYVAIPVTSRELPFQVIRLAVGLNQIQAISRSLYYYIGISIIVGLLASLILGYRFIRQLMVPIKDITDASQKIASGGFDRRVTVTSDDEIGELANNFNHMAARLKDMVGKLSESNTKFKALLTSIKNPIIAVDNKHRIILLNPAAEALFHIKLENTLGKHLLEVIRNNVLDEHIKAILVQNQETQIEIHLHDPEKILKIYSNPITMEEDPTKVMGIVALIEDVTEIRKLEKIRSDFVANVSHELKTPLTSISGFVETLKSGTIEDETVKMRFLDIIDIETERLTRLIDDILTLSEIENIQSKTVNQEINTYKMIQEVEMMIRPIAVNKGLTLMAEVDSNLPPLIANRDWFKQMLINLLDNAIKYTPQGGKIHLNAFQKYNNIIINVKDTGIGIPKKDIPRLFERFYRVDKARSRKVGGTGLGLAIVKHIVLSLGGKIKVNSDISKGTEFTVIIPIKKN
ncbi:two-component system histidine kinase PnpS [Alkaliphilus crotonatoxidans]